jgi:hypothetical protein
VLIIIHGSQAQFKPWVPVNLIRKIIICGGICL